jgi:hypothetical protein
MSDDVSEAEKERAYSAALVLAGKLSEAFGTPGVPPRNRHILALRGLTEFMKAIECPLDWRLQPFELAQAMIDLDFGVIPAILTPAKRTQKTNDETRVWRVRSLAVLAWKARARGKIPVAERLRDLKKRHPTLDAPPYAEGNMRTSLGNWQRRLDDVKIKRGDQLDIVVDEHLSIQHLIDQLPPDHAASVADTLLSHALY